ncbi:heat shock factor protein 5 [Pseudochaenichthys georgianus]|uniref:heat shock factor protein 5 n=1 Tax=Pseudochaenichthys georgianus TaxID=52239 RepID=UPI00146F00BB|nr:heat shock factor protein 5 [Pseudochaenichthys georgianus]
MLCDPADNIMDFRDRSLPDGINPMNFPAKLWRLVNNPLNEGISWDIHGEVILIDQQLFEKQILSPRANTSPDAFKTTNFSSFVRQLNLYGFKKVDQPIKQAGYIAGYHQFINPNFKRDKPAFVENLRRLTAENKAKIKAGVDVKARPLSRFLRFSGGGDCMDYNLKRDSAGSSLLTSHSPRHQEFQHPYLSKKAQAMTSHNGTPVPPRFLIRGHGPALSPMVFAADKGIPVSLSHHYPGLTTGSNHMHLQQSLLARANSASPNFPFSGSHAQYQPGYLAAAYQCCHPSLMASHMAAGGLQPVPLSPHRYYQASYPVNMFPYSDPHQDSKTKEHHELNKCDINLDTIFQIADEVMQTPPSRAGLVRVVIPEKPGPVLVPVSNTSMMSDNLTRPMKACPLSPGPVIMAVSAQSALIHYNQDEKSVISVPEKMPESDIFEDTELIDVEERSPLKETSQANNANCSKDTGSTPYL